jgi:transcriptional regulator with XRE-family HTH domain
MKSASGFYLKGINMCTTTRINMIATGNNIARLRKEKGISVKQIQEVMGFNTPQAIFKWQRGETMPTLDNIVVLSELFNTTIEEIVVVER